MKLNILSLGGGRRRSALQALSIATALAASTAGAQTAGTTTAADRFGVLPEGIGIPAGQAAPDAAVHDERGRTLSLSDLWRESPILLVFYRGGWCPYCTAQIRELVKAAPEYAKRGICPVVISVDRVEESARSQARYAIPFPVLSDPDLEAHRAYRVLNPNDEAATAALKSFGIDLEKASGRVHHTIAVPSVFVIDRGGVIRLAHADRDYKVRPSTAQLLSAIDGLKLPRP